MKSLSTVCDCSTKKGCAEKVSDSDLVLYFE